LGGLPYRQDEVQVQKIAEGDRGKKPRRKKADAPDVEASAVETE
jgi:hypothetical protein